MFPVLRTFGFVAGASPSLCERAALSVVNNTFDEAEDEFRRDGVRISSKRLRTISMKFSKAALAGRRESVAAFKRGEVEPRPSSLRGKRIAVTIDGGRIRTRTAKKGGGKHFFTDWKEPKVFTIYEIDENGRKKRRGFITCGGTIDGPEPVIDCLAAELAAHGVAEAAEVVVIADGAPWIWNRLDELLVFAGIDSGKVTRILDFYHAAEHLKTISELLYKSPPKQTQWFNRMRNLMKTRAPNVFMAELAKSVGKDQSGDLARERKYFETYKNLINYRSFKLKNMPIGSGVIESTIRRVVNLRLKGAGMFWLKENAEGLLHLRCQLKAGTWDEFFRRTLERVASNE